MTSLNHNYCPLHLQNTLRDTWTQRRAWHDGDQHWKKIRFEGQRDDFTVGHPVSLSFQLQHNQDTSVLAEEAVLSSSQVLGSAYSSPFHSLNINAWGHLETRKTEDIKWCRWDGVWSWNMSSCVLRMSDFCPFEWQNTDFPPISVQLTLLPSCWEFAPHILQIWTVFQSLIYVGSLTMVMHSEDRNSQEHTISSILAFLQGVWVPWQLLALILHPLLHAVLTGGVLPCCSRCLTSLLRCVSHCSAAAAFL